MPHHKSLADMIAESLQQSQNVDACKDQVINIIANYGIDFAIGNSIRSNSSDEQFNALVDQFTNAYYNLIRYLEKEGRIRINGVQVSKVLNK